MFHISWKWEKNILYIEQGHCTLQTYNWMACNAEAPQNTGSSRKFVFLLNIFKMLPYLPPDQHWTAVCRRRMRLLANSIWLFKSFSGDHKARTGKKRSFSETLCMLGNLLVGSLLFRDIYSGHFPPNCPNWKQGRIWRRPSWKKEGKRGERKKKKKVIKLTLKYLYEVKKTAKNPQKIHKNREEF